MFGHFSNSARNLFTALAKITCFVFASVSSSLISSSGETFNSHKCRGLPFPLTAPWVDNTQPRKRHCFNPLETWLTDIPQSSDNCLIVRWLLCDNDETTLATLWGWPAAERTSGGMLPFTSLGPPYVRKGGCWYMISDEMLVWWPSGYCNESKVTVK